MALSLIRDGSRGVGLHLNGRSKKESLNVFHVLC